MKKICCLCFLFFILFMMPIGVWASDTASARIGNQFFDTLEEAILASTSTDTISLTSNVGLDETLEIHKTVNINLNNHTIEADERVFLVQGGSLNLSGTGTIKERKPNYGAIMLIGSDDPTKKDFSTVSVGSGVTLQGWSGIFINHLNNTGYGIRVNMNGTINAVDDVGGGTGIGIYVNGNIKHISNSPIVNLTNTARITSTGNGIYAAGYANYTINGAYISGEESGLGIKSGSFNILDGTIVGTGPDKTPTTGNNNGIKPSGTAIQIESNPGYAGNIELYIKNGTIESKNSNVIYEYISNNTNTKVKNISITGGTFTSKALKPVFALSDSFKSAHKSFISGGVFTSDPSSILKSGYSVTMEQPSLYSVISSTMSVFNLNGGNGSSPLTYILIIVSIIGLGMIIYFNWNKILDFISRTQNTLKK